MGEEQDREALGRRVREVWIAWAKEQPDPKPSWLVPWEGLSEPDREVDRRIGEVIARETIPATVPSVGEEQEYGAGLKVWQATRDRDDTWEEAAIIEAALQREATIPALLAQAREEGRCEEAFGGEKSNARFTVMLDAARQEGRQQAADAIDCANPDARGIYCPCCAKAIDDVLRSGKDSPSPAGLDDRRTGKPTAGVGGAEDGAAPLPDTRIFESGGGGESYAVDKALRGVTTALVETVAERDAARADAERCREVLRSVEWVKYFDGLACPSCGFSPNEPHAADCPLAAALRGA